MSDKYFSRVYRGWTLQQTDRGWIIINAPNRDRAGPISPGPYSTFGIAEHVVDRIMDNSYGPKDNPRNQYSSNRNESNDEEESFSYGDPIFRAIGFILGLILSFGYVFLVK